MQHGVAQHSTAQDACACSGCRLGESLTAPSTTVFQSGSLQMHTYILLLLFVGCFFFNSVSAGILAFFTAVLSLFLFYLFLNYDLVFSSRIFLQGSMLGHHSRTESKRRHASRGLPANCLLNYMWYFFTLPRHPKEVCYFLMENGSGRDSWEHK